MGTEDNVPRNAFKPRVQLRKPSMTIARRPSAADEDVLAAEHANFNRMFEKRDEVDEGTSPTSNALPVWNAHIVFLPYFSLHVGHSS